MKLLRFTFKHEAIWMLIFSLGIPGITVLIWLTLWALRGH